MHNEVGFLLWLLQLPATMKNGLLSKMLHSEPLSHNSPFYNVVQLHWEILFQILLNLGIQYKTWKSGVFLTKHSWYPTPHLSSTRSQSSRTQCHAKKYKNQEEKRKLNTRTGKELFNDKLYTINLYPVSEWRHHYKETLFSYQKIWGWVSPPPPPLYPK